MQIFIKEGKSVCPFITTFILCLFLFFAVACNSQNGKKAAPVGTVNVNSTPDSVYGSLFKAVQMQRIFPDGKTFVDANPKRSVADIMYDYGLRKDTGAALKKFITDNFELPSTPTAVASQVNQELVAHIKALWPILLRQPDANLPLGTSLLPLPYPYIVPGGRFREVYYWDSYFTMLGLRVSGENQIIENMVRNFAYLIETYGHIPNGNRTYYLSRSQPPFFSAMVQLLAEIKGDQVLDTFAVAIEKEYQYWMEGDQQLKPGEAFKRVVKMPNGMLMNRYFDDASTPRQESYREDVLTAEAAVRQTLAKIRFSSKAALENKRQELLSTTYAHLRAGAASGWDFSSRWFEQPKDIGSIETTDIIPVDLNCLLYFTESLLAKVYQRKGDSTKAANYRLWATERAQAIDTFCYQPALQFYCDYNIKTEETLQRITAAGMFPFYFFNGPLYQKRAEHAAEVIKAALLKPGGLVTTTVNNGQQWDAPNGWAPLQWMAIEGLRKNGQPDLAAEIAQRWIQLNKAVYSRTGKLMEKYNVENINLQAGGGEYPSQDGFGWTNGVLLALMQQYDKEK